METKPLESTDNTDLEGSFLEMLDQYDSPYPKRGEIVTGEVLYKDGDVVYIDVGSKRDAIIPHEEVQALSPKWLASVSVGDEIPVYITNSPVGNDNLIVSVERVLAERDWERAAETLEKDELIELEVVGYNKGGLLVEFGRIRGFVPNSHVPELRHMRDARDLSSAQARIVGQVLPVKILEMDRPARRLVLSGTAVQKELARKQLLELKKGEKVIGTVVNIKKYGAFLDLGYITGLLHISQIAWTSIGHPSEVFSVGEKVEVLVEEIDLENERVNLSRRALLPSPLKQFAEQHPEGELIEGKVTNIRDFGAFVELEEGIDGLIHISEMNLVHGGHPSDALHTGDQVLVRILRIEVEEGRISLSLSKVPSEAQIAWMQRKQAETPAA